LARIALLLCLGFIFVALRQDLKESRNISKSLWIPFIWLVECASKPLTMWLYPGQIFAERTELNYVEGNSTERALAILLLSAGIAVLFKKRSKFVFRFQNNTYLFIFYLYSLMSIGWSDYQGIALKRWIRLAGDVIMAWIILAEDDQSQAIDHMLRRCAILLIPLSVLFIRFYGNIGIGYTHDGERMWTGVTTNKNSLGFLCAYLGIFLAWRILKEWPKKIVLDGFLLLATLYLLRGSRSATSAIVFILGIIMLISHALLKGNTKNIRKLGIAALLLLVLFQGLSIAIFDKSIESMFFAMTDRNSTFTGRIPLWQALIEIGSQRPILGSGLGNFWIINLRQMWDRFGFHPIQAHNGYIDVFLDLGIVGLIFLFLLIFHTYKKIMESFNENWKFAALMYVLFVTILFHNFTEATLARPANLLWALFLLSTIVTKKRPAPLEAIAEERHG